MNGAHMNDSGYLRLRNNFYRTSRNKLFSNTTPQAWQYHAACSGYNSAMPPHAVHSLRVFSNVHDHLNVVGFVDVELLTHGPKELVFAGRDDAVLEHHLNHVPIVLNR